MYRQDDNISVEHIGYALQKCMVNKHGIFGHGHAPLIWIGKQKVLVKLPLLNCLPEMIYSSNPEKMSMSLNIILIVEGYFMASPHFTQQLSPAI